MTVSVAATTLPPSNKPRWSRAAGIVSSIGGASSLIDLVSVYHRLGRSPTDVRVTLRSVILAPISGGAPNIIVAGWNASVVDVRVTGLAGGRELDSQITFDCTSVIEHTIVT